MGGLGALTGAVLNPRKLLFPASSPARARITGLGPAANLNQVLAGVI
jgi:hypothetical protein